MANYDQRSPVDGKFGQLTAGVTSLDTTLTSPDFASLASDLSTTKYTPITLADDAARTYETVWVTAHSAGSSAVTVVRGREGSTARAWATGSAWRCAPTIRDTIQTLTRGTLPADPHIGMRVFLTDENRIVERTSTAWKSADLPFGHLGLVDGFQSVAGGNGAYALFSAAQELLGGMTFDNANDALVVPIAGLYDIHIKGYTTGGTNYSSSAEATINSTALPPSANGVGAVTTYYKFDSADYIAHGSVRRRLAALDKVRLWQGCPNSTWGTNGYNGAFLEVAYVCP